MPTKKCPKGHKNPLDAVFCQEFGCTHLFSYNHEHQVQVVAAIHRTYPVGTYPSGDDGPNQRIDETHRL